MEFDFSSRLRKLPPYIFARLEQLKREKEASGIDIINFGIGDPDLKPPELFLKKLQDALLKPANHRYPSSIGMMELRQAIAQWYEVRFDVKLDPATEVLVLCGSKEGLAHIPIAFINPGDGVLVPSPGYPVYQTATILAGGNPVLMPMHEEKEFLPEFENVDRRSLDRSRMMFLNFPGNPTAATADMEYFGRAIAFARKHDLLICHDNAYSEIYFDGKRQPSFLQVPGAKDVGVEFHSFSKTFSGAGFRIGWLVGNRRVIDGLHKVKSNMDSGVYQAIQEATIVALEKCWKDCENYRRVYQERRDYLCPELKKFGLTFKVPEASFYIWAKVPRGFSSETFTEKLIREEGIMVTPGTGFGAEGQGYVRFAMTIPIETMKDAVKRMEKIF